ncbi:CBS domain-containing protein [uncultured Sunxiuqinia sp.]|uniref:CBS domain-containing protein n=1 Tax=uncultured Sunxiuqinia sp. TaxID=1573825 RepID=UPI002AA8B91B|nr:CBS domain-containing protein [uncultured Sunxiuqinia sp.]
MIAKELISDVIPSLRLSDDGQKALNWMEIFRISHLPVVDGHEYLGLVSDKAVYDLDLIEVKMEDCRDHLLQPHVHINQHIYEVASIMSELKLTLVPVLDLKHTYQGVISVLDLSKKLASLMAVHEPGGIIVLELTPLDYSLSQIAQIVESNDAKILSIYTYKGEGPNDFLVTLKINQVDLSRIIHTFVRYDYSIRSVFMDDSILNNTYDDRFDQLMKYMNI